jgi:hypothetical protein
MPEYGISKSVHVSLQRRGMQDTPWKGHLASGVLVDHDEVVVPAPPAALLDGETEFEALIFERRPRPDRLIEWIPPTRVKAYYVREVRGAIAATVRLARPSRHQPRFRAVDSRAFDDKLEETGYDVWRTFVELDLIPGDLSERPSNDVFHQIVAIAAKQRQPWITHVPYPRSICWLPFCMVHRPPYEEVEAGEER